MAPFQENAFVCILLLNKRLIPVTALVTKTKAVRGNFFFQYKDDEKLDFREDAVTTYPWILHSTAQSWTEKVI